MKALALWWGGGEVKTQGDQVRVNDVDEVEL